MKVRKPMSKRQPVRLRNKIQKKSAAKQRKDRKDAKKNPQWTSRLKKDPGIPNLFPYKDKLLHQAEDSRRRKLEEAEARKLKARNGNVGQEQSDEDDEVMVDENGEEVLMDYSEGSDEDEDLPMDTDDGSNPMAALLASARARAQAYDHEGMPSSDEDEEEDEVNEGIAPSKARRDTSKKAFDSAFREVISASDIVLYVLDARDPMGTRSRTTEADVLTSPDRRIILVLNKIDLVPPRVLQDWLKYLRKSFPTIPLRASSNAGSNAKVFDHKNLTASHTANVLLKALKNWAGAKGFKRAVNVGVIGYPNVGKSSVINALTSRLSGPGRGKVTACPVGAEAGVTTAMREVKLDGKIKLLDSPGIVFPSAETAKEPHGTASSSKVTGGKNKTEEQARLVLLNAVPPKEITDPAPAVSLLLKRLSATPDLLARMFEVYEIPPIMAEGSRDVTNDFLIHVARKRGRLGRGGVPNLHAAAQTVLSDWREGRIQGWVEAPQIEDKVTSEGRVEGVMANGDERKIVTQWAEEFKIDGLWGDESISQNPDSMETT